MPRSPQIGDYVEVTGATFVGTGWSGWLIDIDPDDPAGDRYCVQNQLTHWVSAVRVLPTPTRT